MLEPFSGFPSDAFAFYTDLGDDANNSKAFFDEHRGRYEQAVRIPMEALLERADDDGFGNGKVYRPNRDVRFSKDKRPYKDHCGAVISFRDGTGRASRYVQVSATGLEIMGSELKRAPRGMDPEHPRIALLRHKRLAASVTWGIEPWVHIAEAYDRITDVWRLAEPMAAWLSDHVGPAPEGQPVAAGAR